MGVESSSLTNIQSLNSTLNNINSKLDQIEADHLKYDQQSIISLDQNLCILGHFIPVNSYIIYTLPPILGWVTETSARILLEINKSTILSICVFFFSEYTSPKLANYLYTITKHIEANTPTVIELVDLQPGFLYNVYIGGIQMNLILQETLTIRTASETSCKHRVLMMHQSRLDCILPGDYDLWQEVDKKIKKNRDGQDHDVMDSTLPSTYLIIHDGNILSLDGVIKDSAFKIIDYLNQSSINEDFFNQLLHEAEESINQLYRRVLSSSKLRNSSKCCVNVFIAGADEAGSLTAVLLSRINSKPIAHGESLQSLNEPNVDTSKEGSLSNSLKKMVSTSNKTMIQRAKQSDEQKEELILLVLAMLLRIARRSYWVYMRQLWDKNCMAMVNSDRMKEELYRKIFKLRRKIDHRNELRESLSTAENQLASTFSTESKATHNIHNSLQLLDEGISQLELQLRELVNESNNLRIEAVPVVNGGCLISGSFCVTVLESSWGWIDEADDQFNQSCLVTPPGYVGIHHEILSSLQSLLHPDLSSLTKDYVEERKEETGLLSESTAVKVPKSSSESKRRHHPIQAVLCVSSTSWPSRTASNLLPNSNASTTNQEEGLIKRRIAQDPEEGLLLISPLDCKQLFSVLSNWQNEFDSRAVLMVSVSTSNTTASGVLIPNSAAASMDNTPIWRLDHPWNRSCLQSIVLSQMDTRSTVDNMQDQPPRDGSNTATTNKWLDSYEESSKMKSMQYPMQTNEWIYDPDTDYYSVYSTFSMTQQRSFWEIEYQPNSAPIASTISSTGYMAAEPAKFLHQVISNPLPKWSKRLGVVIGKVTSSTVQILIETVETGCMQLQCVDQVTGTEHAVVRYVHGHRPHMIMFNDLQSNRSYSIIQPTAEGNPGSQLEDVYLGSFTTNRSFLNQETRNELMSDEVESDGDEEDESKKKEQTPKSDEKVTRSLRNAVSPKENDLLHQNIQSNAAESKPHDADKQASLMPFNIIFIGYNQPSWSTFCNASQNQSEVNLDRDHMFEGSQLMRSMANSLKQPWNGIDLVIHTGCNVDLNHTIQQVISLLCEAEQSELSMTEPTSINHPLTRPLHLSSPNPSHPVTQRNVDRIISEAMEYLREAYRLHWGSQPLMQDFLAHSSHYFMSCPLMDILQLFHVNTPMELIQDLTPYCISMLQYLVTEVQTEYQKQIWSSPLTLNPSPGDREYHTKNPFFHYVANGEVLLFELQPVARIQENYLSMEEGLIPMHQLITLQSLLNSNLKTLILLSPIPVVLDDKLVTDYTLLTSEQLGIRYSCEEVTKLLDILSNWMASSRDKIHEVVIATGGVRVSFTTDISVTVRRGLLAKSLQDGDNQSQNPNEIDDHSVLSHSVISHQTLNNSANDSVSNHGYETLFTFQQMTIGSIIGRAELDDIPVTERTLHSSQYVYRFKHSRSSRSEASPMMKWKYPPSCGLIEIPMRPSHRGNPIRPKRSKSHEEEENDDEADEQQTTVRFLKSNELELFYEDLIQDPIERERLQENVSFHNLLDTVSKVIFPRSYHDAVVLQLKSRFYSFCRDITEAIHYILQQEADAIATCHQAIQSSDLFLPGFDGMTIEDNMVRVMKTFWQHISQQAVSVIKMPSRLVIRLVWSRLVYNGACLSDMNNEEEDEDNGGGMAGVASESIDNEFVIMKIITDVRFFRRLLAKLLEGQLIMDHIAVMAGYCD